MLKILHTADWHIGNFPAPASKTKQNLRFLDICSYIECLIEKAKQINPDIIIIAGDVFNQAKTWSDRGLQETNTIAGYISELSEIAPVCVLRGTPNHDGKMHYDMLATALSDNANVYIVDEPCVKNINNLAAVAFVPIFDKTQHRMETDVPMDKEAENNYFSDKVRDAILDLKQEADAYNLPTILVTHYTVLGSVMPNGQTSIFATNDIVIDPITLTQSDYSLTCLGHIHKPQQLDACPNTFYAGSLCALCFNDENDPHGFYVHNIVSHGNVQSEFIEIPSRKFHTIWFNNTQLSDIIASDYNIEKYIDEPMNGDIVRVIYTCTDITNKALNKALLEKALYETTDAFYVQEITPFEIEMGVDKSSMRNTASIEENLYSYLKNEQTEHGTITDVQIDECIALAKPIIDRILLDRDGEHNVGLFTPIEIEVHNYRNYKDATFNFNDVKFCVINGDNGAGKSSLFMDAMLDALFEETREGEITGWINNDINVRSGSIKFTFAIGDNVYKITRTRQKSGKATLNFAQFVSTNNGETVWNDMSEEKIRDTQAVINRVIGMNAITLKSCGLIMQDAYGLFLQADKNTRMDILSDILNLDIYENISDSIAELAQTCSRNLSQITDDENRIASNLANGDSIKTALNNAIATNRAYGLELEKCKNELLTCSLKKESYAKDVELFNRLTDETNALSSKKQSLTDALAKQNAVIKDAETIVAKENDYIELSKKFAELSEQEKMMSGKAGQIQSLLSTKSVLTNGIQETERVRADACSKIASAAETKRAIENDLLNEDDITSKAVLYETTKLIIAEAETKLAEINKLEADYRAKDAEYNEANHGVEKLKAEYDAKFDEIDKKARILNESGCPISQNATCKFLADAQQALLDKPVLIAEYNAKLCTIVNDTNKIKVERDVIKAEIDRRKESLPDINAKKALLKECEASALKLASISELKKNLAVQEQYIADYEKVCADSDEKLKSLNAQLDELNTRINNLSDEIADYEHIKQMLSSFGDIAAQGNELAAAKATLSAAKIRVNELDGEIKLIDTEIADKINERNSIVIDELVLSHLEATIHASQTQHDLISQQIADTNKTIGKLELDLRNYQNDVIELNKLRQQKDAAAKIAANADWLKKAFNKNGIPHNIVRSIIPALQTTASTILGQMSNNTMSIELKTEKMLTTKKEVATLDIIVCDTTTGDLPYLSRSGGERVKAALSVVLALAEIKSSESGTQLGFLFIDEPPFLDSNGIDAYCDALEAIQKRYADLKIIAITHDPEMKSRFAQSIDVVKTTNGSEIFTNL